MLSGSNFEKPLLVTVPNEQKSLDYNLFNKVTSNLTPLKRLFWFTKCPLIFAFTYHIYTTSQSINGFDNTIYGLIDQQPLYINHFNYYFISDFLTTKTK